MKATLQYNGWTRKSEVRVLADGADGLTNLSKRSGGKDDSHWRL